MGHPYHSPEEIGKRGQEIYENKLRARVETPENFGKIISIDIDTGDYEIDDDLIKAGDRLLARHPGASLYGARIGYDAVYAIGGARESSASSRMPAER